PKMKGIRQDVRDALHEVDVVDREARFARRMDAEHSDRPGLAADDRAEAADDAVLKKQRRSTKARVLREVAHDDRLVRHERIGGLRVALLVDDEPPDEIRPPPGAGPQ